MKYFICALDDLQLGIPADSTERIIPADALPSALTEIINRETYISLTALFKKYEIKSPHGIIIKDTEIDIPRTILLTPKIEFEIEIDEKEIKPLPEALAGIYLFFRGICFLGEKLILILEPVKLAGLL